MPRNTEDIMDIIDALKQSRDSRDDYIESIAIKYDGSNDIEAHRIRSIKHSQQTIDDKKLCVSCKVVKSSSGGVIGISCTTYPIEDIVYPDYIEKGLMTLLADENYNIEVNYTVYNL